MKRALLDEDMIAVALNFPISEYKDVMSVQWIRPGGGLQANQQLPSNLCYSEWVIENTWMDSTFF